MPCDRFGRPFCLLALLAGRFVPAPGMAASARCTAICLALCIFCSCVSAFKVQPGNLLVLRLDPASQFRVEVQSHALPTPIDLQDMITFDHTLTCKNIGKRCRARQCC